MARISTGSSPATSPNLLYRNKMAPKAPQLLTILKTERKPQNRSSNYRGISFQYDDILITKRIDRNIFSFISFE